MDAARPDSQRNNRGREVEWSDSFIEELKLGLVACRVLFVLRACTSFITFSEASFVLTFS